MVDGVMKVSLKDERGMILTQEHGFTIEEQGRVLGFDLYEHPQMGKMLLFGDQVFVLKFWDEEQLEKGLQLLENGFRSELERRRNAAQ